MRHVSRLAVIAAIAFIPLVNTVPAAHANTKPPKPAVCVIHSNPSQVESGEGPTGHSSIADIIQVECQPIYSEAYVMIDATQLSNACQGTLSWAAPPFAPGNMRAPSLVGSVHIFSCGIIASEKRIRLQSFASLT